MSATTQQGEPVDRRKMFRKLASGLMRLADETPGTNIRHHLKNGLKLVVRRDHAGYTLGMWRVAVPPSAAEIEVCKDCFGVASDAMMSTQQKHRGSGDTARPVANGDLWLGFVVTWTAPKASANAPLPGVEPLQPAQ